MNPKQSGKNTILHLLYEKIINKGIRETERDMEELKIIQQDIKERLPLRKKLQNISGFLEKPKTTEDVYWTEDKKEETWTEKHRKPMGM